MQNKKLIWFVFACALALSACGGGGGALPTETPTPPPSGSLPLCAAGSLIAPVLVSPAEGEIGPVYGEEVITEIQYPDANCQPEAFEKFVGVEPALDGENFIINPGPVNILAAPEGYNGSGQLTTTLQDCTQYFWKARAVVGGASGPFSEVHTFFTNFAGNCTPPAVLKPVCPASGLLAPVILTPEQNAVNPEYGTEVITEVQYPDPNCMPEYFEKYVSTDEAFSGTNYIINPGPVNIPAPVGELSGSGQITTPLDDCTQYYLRARAVANGAQGPYSETVTFFTDFESACELPPAFVEEAAAVPSQNANCREGPSATYFDIVDTLYAGRQYTAIGQGPDHLWLLFKAPASSGNCWVYVQNLELSCRGQNINAADLRGCLLPVINYPPIPTPTSTPTFTPEPLRSTPTPPQCSDGRDNDGDGRADSNDRECSSASDNDESK